MSPDNTSSTASPDEGKRRNGGGFDLVTLPASVTIREAASVHQTLVAALGRHRPLRIDGGGVEEADIALFQLLAGAIASAERNRSPLTLTLPRSDHVRRLMRLSGLSARLESMGGGDA